MRRSLVIVWILSLSALPGLSENSPAEPSSDTSSGSDSIVSIAAIGPVLAAASADKISLYRIDLETDSFLVRTGELVLDSPHGKIESLTGGGDLLLVCHRAAVTLVRVPSADRAEAVGSVTLRGPVRGVARLGSYLYASCLPSELAVIDISSPDKPKSVVTVPTRGRPTGILAAGTTVLITSTNERAQILDVSKPQAPADAGFVSGVVPVLIPSPGRAYAWSRQQGQAMAISLNTTSRGRLANVPLSGLSAPTVVCASAGEAYWADAQGRITVIDLAEPPVLAGCIDTGARLTELVPCGGVLCGLSREDSSLLVIDPTVLQPLPEEETAEQVAQQTAPLAGERSRSVSRGPLWGTQGGARARGMANRRFQVPPVPPPTQSAQPQRIPLPPQAASPRGRPKTDTLMGSQIRRLESDPFAKNMPSPSRGRGPGVQQVRPRLRRLIIDKGGYIIPEYGGRTRVDSVRP